MPTTKLKKGKVAGTLSNKEYGIRWTSFSLQLIVLRIFVNDVVGAKSLYSSKRFLFCSPPVFCRRVSFLLVGKKWWKGNNEEGGEGGGGELNMQKKRRNSNFNCNFTRFTNRKKRVDPWMQLSSIYYSLRERKGHVIEWRKIKVENFSSKLKSFETFRN